MGNDWKMDGRVFSIEGLIDIVDSMRDSNDEIRFQFSGMDYYDFKKMVEKGAGLEMCEKYEVSRIINLTNKKGRGVEQSYTVVIRKKKLEEGLR